MTDHQPLFDRLEALVDRNKLPDWDDVVRRAEAPASEGRPAATKRSRRSYLATRLVPALALAIILIALGSIAPWKGSPSFTDRALAAIGEGPVIHAVLRYETGFSYIDLRTGREKPQLQTTEIWFDSKRHFGHFVYRIDGSITADLLSTGKVPRLDPALTGFVDGYRSALKKGAAHVVGKGRLNGHAVTWIEVPFAKVETERIAVDDGSSLPLRVEYRNRIAGSSDGSYDILSIETLPEDGGNFVAASKGPRNRQATGASVPASLSDVSEALPGALWVGKSISGQSLSRIARTTSTTDHNAAGRVTPRSEAGIELNYGDGSPQVMAGARSRKAFLRLDEAARPRPDRWNLQFVLPRSSPMTYCGPKPSPTDSRLPRQCAGFVFKNGVYVTILASSHDLLLAAARALEPIQP